MGKAVARRRNQLGLSQRQLAEEAGVHEALIAKLEQGRSESPSLVHTAKIAARLGLSLDELAGIERPRPTPVEEPATPPTPRSVPKGSFRVVEATLEIVFGAEMPRPLPKKGRRSRFVVEGIVKENKPAGVTGRRFKIRDGNATIEEERE